MNFQITPCNELPGHVSLHHDQCLYLHTVLLGIVPSTNGMQHLPDQGNRHNNDNNNNSSSNNFLINP